ncbi:MAG TPA: hypothetical protein P5154_07995 [Candidatus Izemoplasmatales bacterium]|nr:hypothetical protein [Candidatus Izemoplasmatales bacterium]
MSNRKSEIVNKLLETGLSQRELGEFLGVTRQSIKRCSEGYELSSKITQFALLEQLPLSAQLKMIAIDQFHREMMSSVSKKPRTVDKVHQGFEYMHHWCTSPKYSEDFINYLFGHVVNFHMRYSPYALLYRDYFDRESRMLLTLDIDYANKNIKRYCLASLKERTSMMVFPSIPEGTPIGFPDFIDRLQSWAGDKVQINIYGDNQDDELEFIKENVTAEYKKKMNDWSVYDFSRMFNVFEMQSKVGPNIETVLRNFKIEFDDDLLLKDCVYRSEKVISLVRMVSLVDIRENLKISGDVIFDGASKNSKKKYSAELRRERKQAR